MKDWRIQWKSEKFNVNMLIFDSQESFKSCVLFRVQRGKMSENSSWAWRQLTHLRKPLTQLDTNSHVKATFFCVLSQSAKNLNVARLLRWYSSCFGLGFKLGWVERNIAKCMWGSRLEIDSNRCKYFYWCIIIESLTLHRTTTENVTVSLCVSPSSIHR